MNSLTSASDAGDESVSLNERFEELRGNVKGHWGTHAEATLLATLDQLHTRLMTRSAQTHRKIEELHQRTAAAHIGLANAFNSLKVLSQRQFVQHRIAAEDLQLRQQRVMEEEAAEDRSVSDGSADAGSADSPTHPKRLIGYRQHAKKQVVVRRMHAYVVARREALMDEGVRIPLCGEDVAELAEENPYRHRALCALIGTAAFLRDEKIGCGEEQSGEASAPARPTSALLAGAGNANAAASPKGATGLMSQVANSQTAATASAPPSATAKAPSATSLDVKSVHTAPAKSVVPPAVKSVVPPPKPSSITTAPLTAKGKAAQQAAAKEKQRQALFSSSSSSSDGAPGSPAPPSAPVAQTAKVAKGATQKKPTKAKKPAFVKRAGKNLFGSSSERSSAEEETTAISDTESSYLSSTTTEETAAAAPPPKPVAVKVPTPSPASSTARPPPPPSPTTTSERTAAPAATEGKAMLSAAPAPHSNAPSPISGATGQPVKADALPPHLPPAPQPLAASATNTTPPPPPLPTGAVDTSASVVPPPPLVFSFDDTLTAVAAPRAVPAAPSPQPSPPFPSTAMGGSSALPARGRKLLSTSSDEDEE